VWTRRLTKAATASGWRQQSTETPAKRLNVPLPAGQSTDYVMNASMTSGRLSSYAKGRGLNDWREAFDWEWSGSDFVLVNAFQSPLCRGMPGGGFSLRIWTAQ